MIKPKNNVHFRSVELEASYTISNRLDFIMEETGRENPLNSPYQGGLLNGIHYEGTQIEMVLLAYAVRQTQNFRDKST